MIRVALLGKQFAEQLRTNAEELRELDVAWMGYSVETFRRVAPGLGIGALVLDIADLPELDAAAVRDLVKASGAELSIVSYSYRTRSFLRELRADDIRLLQAPLTLTTVRAHLAFLMVQDLLGSRGRPPREATGARPLSAALTAAHPSGCSCGNELEHVMAELIATQAREQSCAGRGRGDAQTHQNLELLTQRARAVIEEALTLVRPQALPRPPSATAP